MFFTYLWQSSGLDHKDARERFVSILLKQCRLYKEAFGYEPSIKIKQIANILIGQIQYETGIVGWEPWLDKGETGIIWGGVCENYLGEKMDTEEIDKIIKLLETSPKDLLSWNGMFSVISWDENKVLLTTAATECPTLWHTEGPFGWASGPRGAPILEMAGTKAMPNKDAMGLYLLYGYFIGGHSPFQNVHRIQDRQQIIIEKNANPIFQTYVSIKDFLTTDKVDRNWSEVVAFGAEHLVQRVDKQMRHSLNPVVLLTGGRDSRAIAAAAKNTGKDFITATSGSKDSQDVFIAAKVANKLDVLHRQGGEAAAPALLIDSMDRLKLWTQINEGLLPIIFTLHMNDFLLSNLPFPAVREQYFHGHEPNIGRCLYYPGVAAEELKTISLHEAHKFMTYKNRFLKHDLHVNDLLQNMFSKYDSMISETQDEVFTWFEFVYWRERGLSWGMDLQSVYSPNRWAWTPLFDRELLIACRNLTVEQKRAGNFLVDVAKALQPSLADIQWTSAYALSAEAKFSDRVRQRVTNELKHYLNKFRGTSTSDRANIANQDLSKFWEQVFFSKAEGIWRDFITEKNLKLVIHISPYNDLLWRLATIELFAETHF